MATRIALIALLLTACACTPSGTWSRHGASSQAHVYMAPAPQAMAKSINWWIIREYGTTPDVVPVALIDALHPAADKVLALVPNSELVAMDDPLAIRVEALRLTRNTASIDLSAPRKGLPRQLITIDMRRYNGPPWKVTGANWWRFNEQQLQDVHEQLQAQEAVIEDNAVAEDEAADLQEEVQADAAADGDS